VGKKVGQVVLVTLNVYWMNATSKNS